MTKIIEIEDFSISQEPGKEMLIKINLKDGSHVKVGSNELAEYDRFQNLYHFLRDDEYYKSGITAILETYLYECEDYKVERSENA